MSTTSSGASGAAATTSGAPAANTSNVGESDAAARPQPTAGRSGGADNADDQEVNEPEDNDDGADNDDNDDDDDDDSDDSSSGDGSSSSDSADTDDNEQDTHFHVNVRQLNPELTCTICRGYFREASTLTECQHTFCKTCILKLFATGVSTCPEVTCGIDLGSVSRTRVLSLDTVFCPRSACACFTATRLVQAHVVHVDATCALVLTQRRHHRRRRCLPPAPTKTGRARRPK